MGSNTIGLLEKELRYREDGWWERLSIHIPELRSMAGTPQPKNFHAEGDVATHTQLAVEACPENSDPDLFWAALLHDIGKPATTTTQNGSIKAHGHDKVGAAIAANILARLGMPEERKNRIIWAVNHHLFHHSWQLNDINQASKRHKSFVGNNDFPFLLDLLKVDALASKGNPRGLSTYNFYKKFREHVENLKV